MVTGPKRINLEAQLIVRTTRMQLIITIHTTGGVNRGKYLIDNTRLQQTQVSWSAGPMEKEAKQWRNLPAVAGGARNMGTNGEGGPGRRVIIYNGTGGGPNRKLSP